MAEHERRSFIKAFVGIVIFAILLILTAVNRWLAKKTLEYQRLRRRKERLPGYPYTPIDEG